MNSQDDQMNYLVYTPNAVKRHSMYNIHASALCWDMGWMLAQHYDRSLSNEGCVCVSADDNNFLECRGLRVPGKKFFKIIFQLQWKLGHLDIKH